MMNGYREKLLREAESFISSAPHNVISPETARTPAMAGLVLFDAPVVGVAAADDPLFDELKKPGVMGPHVLGPAEWMSGAKSVISVLLLYSGRVRASNRENFDWPSIEWTHGRIEGHAMVENTIRHLIGFIEKLGYRAMSPLLDPRLGPKYHFDRKADANPPPRFNSRWSERHAAYIAGLGTFGLSCGLISHRGMAGRFGSIISDMELTPDPRPYTGIFDYCIKCGKCVKNCPVGAIGLETGKDHPTCSAFLDKVLEKEGHPYYGCGKCQVGVPCETGIPKRM